MNEEYQALRIEYVAVYDALCSMRYLLNYDTLKSVKSINDAIYSLEVRCKMLHARLDKLKDTL